MPQEADPARPGTTRFALRGVLVVVVLAALAGWTWRQLAQGDAQIIPWGQLWLPVLCNLVFLVLASWRMQVFSPQALRFWTCVKSLALVASLLIAFPSRLSDLIKPVYLREREGLPMAQGFSILLLERALDVVMVLGIVGIIALSLGGSEASAFGVSLGALLAISLLLTVCLGALLFAPGILRAALGWLPFARLRSFALQMLEALIAASTGPRLLIGTGVSALIWLCSYLIFYSYLIFIPLGDGVAQLDALAILIVFAVGTFGLIATVTPGGIGTYEFAIALALSSFGVPLAEGLVHGLMLRALVLAPNLIIVTFMTIFDGFSLGDMRMRIVQVCQTK